LCSSLRQAGQYEEALKACDEAIKLNNRDPEVWGDRGAVTYALGKFAETVAAYQQITKILPSSSWGWARQCQAQVRLGQYDAATGSCDAALRLDNDWRDVRPALAWYYKGKAQEKRNQLPEAAMAYDWATRLQPNYSQAWAAQCWLLNIQKQPSQALASCDRALRENGDWGEDNPGLAWRYAGQIQRQQGWYDEALMSYEKATAFIPEDPQLWTEQGMVYNALSKDGEALQAHEWALKLKENFSLALANKCATLNRLGQKVAGEAAAKNFTDALEACDLALQKGDNQWGDRLPAFGWVQRGNALVGLARYEEALGAANRAVALDSTSADPWNTRAVALWALGRYSDALSATDRAISLNPQSTQAWFNQGRILAGQGKYREAIAAYQRALQGDGNYVAKDLFAAIWINQSAALLNLGDDRAALDATSNALTLNPDSAAAWYNRALVLTKQMRYTQALSSYDEALQRNQTDANIWTGKGAVLQAIGNYEQAIAAFQEALKLNPNQIQAQQNLELLQSFLPAAPAPETPPPAP
jgi:tetratricopeptide (TPR) repeat protein